MTHETLTIDELTARAAEAAKRYRDLVRQGVRRRSSRAIASDLESIASRHIRLAADHEHSRSRLGERIRAGIASGEIDPATVVIYGIGRVSESPNSKLQDVVKVARELGGSGRYVAVTRLYDTRGESSWLVFGPVIKGA